MIGFVAFAAFAFAAMRALSTAFLAIIFLMAVASLLASTLGATIVQGPSRARWLGASLLGWSYVLLVAPLADWFRPGLVSAGLDDLFESIQRPAPQAPAPESLTFTELIRWDAERDVLLAHHEALKGRFYEVLVGLPVLPACLIGSLAGQSFATRLARRVPPPARPLYTDHREEPR